MICAYLGKGFYLEPDGLKEARKPAAYMTVIVNDVDEAAWVQGPFHCINQSISRCTFRRRI